MTYRIGPVGLLAFQALLTISPAQETVPHEPGVVYYADGSSFKPLAKDAAPARGRARFSAKIEGAHAAVQVSDHARTFGQRLLFAGQQSTAGRWGICDQPTGEEYAFTFGAGGVKKVK